MNNIIKINKKYLYNELKNDLYFLKYEYNEIFIGNIGKTVLGEDIKFVRLGEGKRKIFINASHHANEWITSLIIMMFIENYLNMKKNKQIYKGYNIEKLWNNCTLYVVPMVNPDGVNLCLGDKNILENEKYKYIWNKYKSNLNMWKANIRRC